MRIFSVSASIPVCILLSLPVLSTSMPCRAADLIVDETAIAQLELRAQQANPREQCFLYTELVQDMTAIAGRELLNGESERASATLKRIEHYANLIHVGLAHDTKRVKQAQIAMNGATRRLGEYLHMLSPEDKQVVQGTLKHLDQVNDELLAQVFAH